MLRKKGKLVAPRNVKKMSDEEIKNRAKLRAQQLLGGESNWKKLREQYNTLYRSKPANYASLADGLIMSLIQRNFSNLMIRETFRCGGPRIRRIRKLMANPHLQKIERKPPPHAVTEKQLDELKNHIRSYDLEDGFACAHRRPRKFFIQQGLK